MRGALLTFRRICAACTAVLILTLTGIGTRGVVFAAPGPIDNARARVVSLYPGLTGVGTEVYFVVPTSAQQIKPSDHILITFLHFDDVKVPTLIEGQYYGTPTYSVRDKTIDITGLVVLPGSGVGFSGITVSNPPEGQSSEILIQISEDANGTVIRNQTTVVATDSNYQTTVTAIVESDLSSLSASGFTGPGSFVTLVDDAAVIATTQSDGVGYFNFSLTALVPGNHSFRFFSTDSSNRSTSQTSLNLFLRASYLTTMSGILLSPTIILNKTEIKPGDTLAISGSAKPGAQINIFLESPLQSFTATAQANGEWTHTLTADVTNALNPGEYQTYAVAQDAVGNQSITSNTITFTVKTGDTVDNPPPACDISTGDLNCDSETNLVDFSILMFHWDTNHRLADINNDGTVDLVDFSVMMYYFKF